MAFIERNLQVPTLVSFESRFGDTFVQTKNADLRVIQSHKVDRKVGMVVLGKGSWPGVAFHDLWPDWRNYSTLVIDIAVDANEALELNVRVHDIEHGLTGQSFDDRFNTSFTLSPGTHALRIPLDAIQEAPKARKMDLTQVSALVLFSQAKYAGRTFTIHEISLQ